MRMPRDEGLDRIPKRDATPRNNARDLPFSDCHLSPHTPSKATVRLRVCQLEARRGRLVGLPSEAKDLCAHDLLHHYFSPRLKQSKGRLRMHAGAPPLAGHTSQLSRVCKHRGFACLRLTLTASTFPSTLIGTSTNISLVRCAISVGPGRRVGGRIAVFPGLSVRPVSSPCRAPEGVVRHLKNGLTLPPQMELHKKSAVRNRGPVTFKSVVAATNYTRVSLREMCS